MSVEEQLRYGPTLVESIWRHRVIVAAVTLVLGLAGYVLGTQEAEAYDASARLFLADPNATIAGDRLTAPIDISEYVPRQAARLTSRSVLQSAIANEGDRIALSDLERNLTIEGSIEELSLTITVTDDTAQGAADLANAVASAYSEERLAGEEARGQNAVAELQVQEAELDAEIAVQQSRLEADPDNLAAASAVQALNEQLIDIRGRIQDALLQISLVGDGVEAVEPAEPPGFPSRPRPRLSAIVLAFLGFVGSTMWAYWYASRSQRVLTRTDPQKVLGVDPLGEIPLYRVSHEDPLTGLLRVDPAAAEAYEFVLSSIEFALADIGGKSLLITSPLPGDGKTTTTLQLAIAASRDRRRVALVDADIRARGLTKVLGADERLGLSDLAANELEPRDVLRRYRFSEQAQLPVVTAGQRRGDPAALLRTSAFRQAMEALTDSVELLIADASPLLAVADATIAAGTVDGIVLVVSHGTPVSELEKVRERLKFVSTPLLGYIFNRSDSTTAGAYGYGYGIAEDLDGERRLLPQTSRRRPGSRPSAEQAKPAAPTG